MLNFITKILVGAAVALTATVTVAVVIDEKNKKKYAELGASEAPEEDINDRSIKAKIKRAAKRMVEFVIDHQRELTAISLVIGMADAFVQLNTHLPSKGTGIKKQNTKVVTPAPAPVVNDGPACYGGVLEWGEPGKDFEGSAFVEVLEEDRDAFVNLLGTTNKNAKITWEVL